MRVERFALFFPPLLWTVKRGETEYGIGAIPLGGYVKITGMNPAEEIPPEHAHRAYYKQPVWKRLVVIGAGPAMNVLVAFVILFVLFAAKGDQVVNNKVGDVAPKSAAVGVLQAGRPARRRRRRQGRPRGPAQEHRQAHLRRQRQGRGLRRRHPGDGHGRPRRPHADARDPPALQQGQRADAARLLLRRRLPARPDRRVGEPLGHRDVGRHEGHRRHRRQALLRRVGPQEPVGRRRLLRDDAPVLRRRRRRSLRCASSR